MQPASVTFDTHFYIKKLKDNGITEAQAEALVDLVRNSRQDDLEQLATKGDIKDVRSEIKDVKSEVKELRTELHGAIRESELRMTIRLGGMIVALGGLLVAIKYFG